MHEEGDRRGDSALMNKHTSKVQVTYNNWDPFDNNDEAELLKTKCRGMDSVSLHGAYVTRLPVELWAQPGMYMLEQISRHKLKK